MADSSLDACLRLVADRNQRRVIQHLRNEPGGVTRFDELVDQLHGDGGARAADRLGEREQLAIQLQHTCLPKLSQRGVVEYDQRSGTIRYHPSDQIEAVLDSLPEEVSPSEGRSTSNPRGEQY